jgi:hypothetical protein
MAKAKTLSSPRLLKKAQDTFNAYIRARDCNKSCISCGGTVQEAGHYVSQGHHSALQFNEVNVNGQCTRCNWHLHGNLILYRSGLVKRYGEQKVLLLEHVAKRPSKKWTRFELMAIIQYYQEETKKLSQ